MTQGSQTKTVVNKSRTKRLKEHESRDDGASSSGQSSEDDDGNEGGTRRNVPDMQEKVVERSPLGRFMRFNRKLGSGAHKTVYLGFDADTGKEVAWNVINPEDMDQKAKKRIAEEIHMLKSLKHPRIIAFINAWINKQQNQVCFITERVTGGSLLSYIRRIAQPLKKKVMRTWSKQILEGLDYLHTRDPAVIHRDLKCDNIFINGNVGEVLIGDLGLSTTLKQSCAKSIVGTPDFIAPEIYEEKYGVAVDIYAFGMCLLEMLVVSQAPKSQGSQYEGFLYEECSTPAQVYRKVINGEKPRAVKRIKDKQIFDIVDQCIEKDPGLRPQAGQMLTAEWLADNNSDGDQLCELIPVEELPLDGSGPAAQLAATAIGELGVADVPHVEQHLEQSHEQPHEEDTPQAAPLGAGTVPAEGLQEVSTPAAAHATNVAAPAAAPAAAASAPAVVPPAALSAEAAAAGTAGTVQAAAELLPEAPSRPAGTAGTEATPQPPAELAAPEPPVEKPPESGDVGLLPEPARLSAAPTQQSAHVPSVAVGGPATSTVVSAASLATAAGEAGALTIAPASIAASALSQPGLVFMPSSGAPTEASPLQVTVPAMLAEATTQAAVQVNLGCASTAEGLVAAVSVVGLQEVAGVLEQSTLVAAVALPRAAVQLPQVALPVAGLEASSQAVGASGAPACLSEASARAALAAVQLGGEGSEQSSTASGVPERTRPAHLILPTDVNPSLASDGITSATGQASNLPEQPTPRHQRQLSTMLVEPDPEPSDESLGASTTHVLSVPLPTPPTDADAPGAWSAATDALATASMRGEPVAPGAAANTRAAAELESALSDAPQVDVVSAEHHAPMVLAVAGTPPSADMLVAASVTQMVMGSDQIIVPVEVSAWSGSATVAAASNLVADAGGGASSVEEQQALFAVGRQGGSPRLHLTAAEGQGGPRAEPGGEPEGEVEETALEAEPGSQSLGSAPSVDHELGPHAEPLVEDDLRTALDTVPEAVISQVEMVINYDKQNRFNVAFDFDKHNDTALLVAKELRDGGIAPTDMPLEELCREIEAAIISRCRKIAATGSLEEISDAGAGAVVELAIPPPAAHVQQVPTASADGEAQLSSSSTMPATVNHVLAQVTQQQVDFLNTAQSSTPSAASTSHATALAAPPGGQPVVAEVPVEPTQAAECGPITVALGLAARPRLTGSRLTGEAAVAGAPGEDMGRREESARKEQVTLLQRSLAYLIPSRQEEDFVEKGEWCDATRKAVIEFQEYHSLPGEKGNVDERLWTRLEEEVRKKEDKEILKNKAREEGLKKSQQAREQRKQAQDRESALQMEALMGKSTVGLDKSKERQEGAC